MNFAKFFKLKWSFNNLQFNEFFKVYHHADSKYRWYYHENSTDSWLLDLKSTVKLMPRQLLRISRNRFQKKNHYKFRSHFLSGHWGDYRRHSSLLQYIYCICYALCLYYITKIYAFSFIMCFTLFYFIICLRM